MTTTPTEPTVSVQTVDSTGQLGTIPVADLMPQPVEGEQLEVKPVGGAREYMKRHNVPKKGEEPKYLIDMDEASVHWAYAGVDYEMTFVGTASQDDEHSVLVKIRGPKAGTFPQITEWHTPKPKAGETGDLTVSVIYWQSKPIWSARWSPVVAE